MTALPPAADIGDTARTNALMRATFLDLRAFLAGLLGETGEPAAALAALGPLVSGHVAASAARDLTAADRGRVLTCTGTWTLTLGAAATLGAGFAALVVNTGSGTVTLQRSGGDTVDGATSVALAAGRAALVLCTGTAWLTLALPGTAAGPVLLPAGTAGAPGLAFSGDADSGLYRIGADILGLAAGGAERARVTTAGMQVTGAITGTAVTQSATDTTAGRLMKTGDAGVLSTIPVLGGSTNLRDRDLATGWYGYNSGTVTDGPDASVSFARGVHVWQFSTGLVGGGNTRRMWLDTRAVTTGAVPRIWLGVNQNNDAITWSELFHQANILGTVSQASGVPTGRVIERGSNANGEYVRFADGTQICTRRVSASLAIDTGLLGGFRSAAQTWTFPVAFAAAPALGVTPENLTAFGGVSANAPGTTSAQWAATAATTQTSATREVALIAIGRWF